MKVGILISISRGHYRPDNNISRHGAFKASKAYKLSVCCSSYECFYDFFLLFETENVIIKTKKIYTKVLKTKVQGSKLRNVYPITQPECNLAWIDLLPNNNGLRYKTRFSAILKWLIHYSILNNCIWRLRITTYPTQIDPELPNP